MSKKQSLPDLPQEIIINILSRLPVKSLSQFKSVSKPWLSLISNSHFAKLHLQQMKQSNTVSRRIFSPDLWSFNPEECVDDMGFYNHQEVTLREHRLPIMENLVGQPHHMVGSCNGLICFICEDAPLFQHRDFAVVNPTTRKFRKLPTADSSHQDQGRVFCGFGYDLQIDDYKIVRYVVPWPSDNGGIEFRKKAIIQIFNLKSSSWRRTIHDDQHCSVGIRGQCVFLNGILHWISSNEIIRFDLVEERFMEAIPLPSQFERNIWQKVLVLEECLCSCSQWDATESPIFSKAWKMTKYGVHNSWTRIYHCIDGSLPDFRDWLHLLYISKSGCLWFTDARSNLIVFNPKNKRIDPVQLSVADSFWRYNTIYEESLISPNIAD